MNMLVDGLAATAMALAIILSAIVSSVAASARKQAIIMAEAKVQDLCELTGIMDPRELQDVFGPPNLARVWQNLTLAQVLAQRRPAGYVISSQAVDGGCALVAIFSFFVGHPLVSLALVIAFCLQIAGWVLVYRLPK